MEFGIIILVVAIALVFYALGRLAAQRNFAKREKEIRKDAAERSRSVIGGQFAEQLAPYLPDFPYKPTEVKFLGKPVDFLVFEGLDEKEVTRVVFLEVKSGNARLSGTERALKHAIVSGNVAYEEYRIPAEITRQARSDATDAPEDRSSQ